MELRFLLFHFSQENFIEFARKASEGNERDHSNGLGSKLLAAAAVLGIAALGLFAVGKSH